jgi:alkylation response protein AidB-like acyl-CoA dehydrogenase
MLMLGIARHAIDALVALASDKVPTKSRALLKERPLAQLQTAQAEALVGSARAYLIELTRETWASFAAGGEPSELHLTRLGLSAVYAADSAVQAVELMYKAGGGSAIYSSSVLDRCMRDVGRMAGGAHQRLKRRHRSRRRVSLLEDVEQRWERQTQK